MLTQPSRDKTRNDPPVKEVLLVVNCGSSSVKVAAFSAAQLVPLFSGIVEELNSERCRLKWSSSVIRNGAVELGLVGLEEVFQELFSLLKAKFKLSAVGHRVVHGGERFSDSQLIDTAVLQGIATCSALAPLHNPINLKGIEAVLGLDATLPQVAVFDTAFHQSMPKHAYTYAVPYEWYAEFGVRRYGFHGTSHSFVMQQACEMLSMPVSHASLITVHLGNGASAAAIVNGKCVDTTMGLTPLEGFAMGTRSGDVDPALHAYLVDNTEMDFAQVHQALNNKSGLLGLSGLSSDMRELRSAAGRGHARAQLAIDVFCHRIARLVGGLATSLEHLDAIVFTGGIGENDAQTRAQVMRRLALLGFEISPKRNQSHGAESKGLISTDSSTPCLVVPTNEELKIASEMKRILDL